MPRAEVADSQSRSGPHNTELSNLSRGKSHLRASSKGFAHVQETDGISETVNAGSIHGSESGLVHSENEIRVKHEYEGAGGRQQ